MTQKRYHQITYDADIQGGEYPMTALLAPAIETPRTGKPWRVVAIPGTPSRDYVFLRFLARAPADMEVVMVRRAGYGGPHYGSGRLSPVLDFNEQVRAVAPLFQKDDGKQTIIMGVSYGGALALKCALDFPDYIHGAITVAMLVSEPRAYVRSAVSLGGALGVHHALPNYLKTARREVIGRRSQIGPLFDRLKTLKQPVTVMHGNRDTLVPLSAAHELLDYLGPNSDVDFCHVDGGTHYLECERPNLIYQEIEKLKGRIANGAREEIAKSS